MTSPPRATLVPASGMPTLPANSVHAPPLFVTFKPQGPGAGFGVIDGGAGNCVNAEAWGWHHWKDAVVIGMGMGS